MTEDDPFTSVKEFNALTLKEKLEYAWKDNNCRQPVHKAAWEMGLDFRLFRGKEITQCTLVAKRGGKGPKRTNKRSRFKYTKTIRRSKTGWG